MALKLNIIALSKFDPKTILDNADTLNLWNIAGYSAGICYMPEDYFTSDKCTIENNIKRFENCVNNGHQSVADHAWVEIKLTGISKALAMWLNSLKFYVTSEKSARYTIMDALYSEKYDKWREKGADYIKQVLPDHPDKRVEKMAAERARMMLDINAPMTTMAYSATLRQWNIIYDWCTHMREYWVGTYSSEHLPTFYAKLVDELEELAANIRHMNILVDGLVDIKNCFPNAIMPPFPDGLSVFHCFPVTEHENDTSFINPITSVQQLYVRHNTITVGGYATPAMLAQLQRHRRLTVKMDFNDAHFVSIPCPFNGYDAKLDEDLKREWAKDIDDMCKSGRIPIGVGIPFTCTGAPDDIYTMVVERCCGCAQKEIRDFACNVRDIFCESFPYSMDQLDIDAIYTWGDVIAKYERRAKPNQQSLTRCSVCKCNNPCEWIKDPNYLF